MSVTAWQMPPEQASASTGNKGDKATLYFGALGSTSLTEVAAAVLAFAPATYVGLYRQTLDADHKGEGLWHATVQYSSLEPLTDALRFTAETTGGTTRIEQSFDTTSAWGDDADAEDFGHLIGVHNDKVEGCEIVIPKFGFTVTKKFVAAALAADFLASLYRATGKTNSTEWTVSWLGQVLSFETGEVLFQGINVSDGGVTNGVQYIEISYKFEASRNASDLTVGDITGIFKYGWDFLWVLYEDSIDDDVPTKTPIAVYCEQVYEGTEFSLLGI